LEELDYDPEERRHLEEKRASLQPLVLLMPLLEEAQRAIPQHLERLQEHVRQQVRMRAELTRLEASIKDESCYGISLEEAESRVSRTRERLGSLKAQKELAEKAKAALEELAAKRKELADRLEVLTMLERACNKNTGVPT